MAENGSLFFSPPSGSFKVGETFSVELKLDTAEVLINAAEVKFYFLAENLEVLKITKEGSVFSLWPKEPIFSNDLGEISFAGGLPHPGFKGTGKMIIIEFKAKKEGEAVLSFDESRILADDGQGTNILVFLNNPKYLIYQPKETSAKADVDALPIIFSPTHPREEEWYSNNTPSFNWGLNENTEGVSFILDQNPDTLPDTVSENLVSSKNYEGIADGIWYFHLRLKNEKGWTIAGHYKLKIDTQPPHTFEITIDNKGDSTNPNPSLYFETQDDISGIEKYRVKIGDEEFFDLLTAQISPKLMPGSYRVVVRAVDKAYNIVRAKALLNIDPIETPTITIFPEKYVAGEETLYMEGTALPKVDIMVFLKDDKEEIKKWQTTSNDKGEWSFSTKDLVKPGIYNLSVMAQDERGAVSNYSQDYKIEVSFSGLSIGGLMVTFKNLILILIAILLLGILFAAWYVYKAYLTKKTLKKEIKEAKDSLVSNFANLEKEIEKKIEFVDLQPGLNEQEKKAYENIRESLKNAQQSIDKEIKDIEKGLE
ncbi:MAG: hypothetical protein NTV01_08440 [Bacteroidia bacterium]|nr:hypothetical protein [Bacteroidia bacterium]